MIDHTAHSHPSTPKARALCRANGGTGDTTPKAKTTTKAKTSTSASVTKVTTAPKAVTVPASKVAVMPPVNVRSTPKKTATKAAPKKVDPPAPATNAAVPPRNLAASMRLHIPEFFPKDMDATDRKIGG